MRPMIDAGEQKYRRSVPRARPRGRFQAARCDLAIAFFTSSLLFLCLPPGPSTPGRTPRSGRRRLLRPSVSFRKRRAEHGEAALRFGLRRLVLHDVPMFCETSVHDTEDVDDDPGRPPTPTEAPVHHDVVALGDCERAFVPPRETTYQREQPVPPGGDPCAVLDVRGREVLRSGLEVSPVEECVECLENQRLVSRLLL